MCVCVFVCASSDLGDTAFVTARKHALDKLVTRDAPVVEGGNTRPSLAFARNMLNPSKFYDESEHRTPTRHVDELNLMCARQSNSLNS